MGTTIKYLSEFEHINRSLFICAELGGNATLRIRKRDNGNIIREFVNKDAIELLEVHTNIFFMYSWAERIEDELAGE